MKFKVVHPESDSEWIEEYDTEEEFLEVFVKKYASDNCSWFKLVDGKWK